MNQNENPNTSGPLPTFESFIASRKAEKVEENQKPFEEGQAVAESAEMREKVTVPRF